MTIEQNSSNNNSLLKKYKNFYRQNKKTFWLLFIVLFLFLIAVHVALFVCDKYNKKIIPPSFSFNKTDDWKYKPQDNYQQEATDAKLFGVAENSMNTQSLKEASNIGLAVGGAKDINNFRENISNNFLPLPSDITYEGLFYNYYFDTGKKEECQKLFCSSFAYAISPDPISQNSEYYLSVGLNSGIKTADFKRKKLNLVIVLDISESMNSTFDKYYYDQAGTATSSQQITENNKTKMEIATESLSSMLDYLNDDDRLGIVLFNSDAYIAKPINFVGLSDLKKIKEHIKTITPQGNTKLSAGIKQGTGLYNEILSNDYEYENRIILLTDAMPNAGETSDESLSDILNQNAENGIYATTIGVGVDFNTDLVEKITKIRGANYYSVHNEADFKKRLNDEFEYMVTPLVFDLKLKIEAPGYEIEKVFGSPEADLATREIMKVNTLFPSSAKNNDVKGGIILLKLKKLNDDKSIKIITSYESRDGTKDQDKVTVDFSPQNEFYSHNGIRKGIVLSRYVSFLKNWIIDTRSNLAGNKADSSISTKTGIIIPSDNTSYLGEWERQSTPLRMGSVYTDLINKFNDYFTKEKEIINDNAMNQEIEVLNKLIESSKKEEDANRLTFADSNICYLACKSNSYENGNCMPEASNKQAYIQIGVCQTEKTNPRCEKEQCNCYCYGLKK
jgi:Ca-activated chloride channel homolog